jgi:hypothetical protein
VAEKSTYIKMDRNLRFWRWFKNPKTVLVWIWLIMSANIEDHDFEHETIHRGEVATSRKSISAATGLTEREVRTALDHLKSTGEVSVRIRSKYQVITILRYCDYQDVPSGNASGKSPAKVRQKSGKGPQSKNGKNGKNEKNGKNVLSTPQQADAVAYFAEHGRSEADAMKFFRYNQARGWKINKTPIDDWKAAADIWFDEAPDVGVGSDNTELDAFGKPIQKEFV